MDTDDDARLQAGQAPDTGWKPQPELAELFRTIVARATDRAMRDASEQVQRLRAQAAARGALRGSNTLRGASEVYLEAIARAAETSRTEMLESVRAIYGDVDAEHARHVLAEVHELADRLVRGVSGQVQELLAGRGFQLPPAVIESLVREFQGAAGNLKRDASIAVEPLVLRAKFGTMARQVRSASEASGTEFDLFVSYAGEDNDSIVRPLVEELQRRNLSVWYAGQQPTMGDSLSEKINDGLARARYGVLVLSPAFLEKNWPMFELHTLVAIAATVGRKKLLPVWHGVTHEELNKRVPTLAGLVGVPSSVGIQRLADEISAGMN